MGEKLRSVWLFASVFQNPFSFYLANVVMESRNSCGQIDLDPSLPMVGIEPRGLPMTGRPSISELTTPFLALWALSFTSCVILGDEFGQAPHLV